ncbi:MAG: SGNH/GDSL hydrolase family protein, partial [Caldimonas sp.]
NHILFRRHVAASVMVVTAFACAPASAMLFDTLFIFGDSLSDTGNLNLASSGAFPDHTQGPYFGGRYSNGPLWVETLAADMGFAQAASPYLIGGNNYAFAGARTGTANNPPGVLAQVAGIWGANNTLADPNALYVVVGGGNDMRDARSRFTSNSSADQAGREAAAEAAVASLASSLGFLASHGAKHVMISDLPDLGGSPEANQLGLTAASTDATNRFNALLPGLLTAGKGFGLDMSFLDMAGVLQGVVTDATTNGGAKYGITDVTSPCAGFLGSTGDSCAISLFSDVLHPSAAAHALIGNAAFALVAAVPEPETYALVAFGLLGVLVRARRSKQVGAT